MSKILIGVTPAGKKITLDLDIALISRLLIQANSGGGKSFLLRRLAEQLFGKVQTIILDPEGEFSTLREKFGYVLVGEHGETPADVRSAETLAIKLLELRAPAVCDLYEAFRSSPMQRREWVRRFLTALIDAPRKLWHPLVVIVDEAHKFCPQETPKAASMTDREIISGCKEAMIALATTGRKRGFCPIWATQRLAKLDKDASAELFNRLVGMTIEDVDVDRAAELMSVSRENRQEFKQSLRTLSPGEFYAFGRAIASERVLVKVGAVETSHPESGRAAGSQAAVPQPDEVKALLPQLADLPQQAEQKAKTEAELRRELRAAQQELAKVRKLAAQAEAPVAAKADVRAASSIARAEGRKEGAAELSRVVCQRAASVSGELGKALDALGKLSTSLQQLIPADFEVSVPKAMAASAMPVNAPPVHREPIAFREDVDRRVTVKYEAVEGKDLSGGARKLVAALLAYPDGVTRSQAKILCGFAERTLTNYVSELNGTGALTKDGRVLKLTAEAQQAWSALAGDVAPPTDTAEVVKLWRAKLSGGAARLLEYLVVARGEAVARESAKSDLGFAERTLTNYVSELSSAGLLSKPASGSIAANREALFL